MAPVVQRVRFGNQAVFPHNLPHTAIRLEDTGTQEDVSAGEDRHKQEEHIMQQKQRAMHAAGKADGNLAAKAARR